MDKSLSLAEIRDIVGDSANVTTYRDVHECNTIEDLLKNNACILLYFSTENYGHWITILRHPHSIEFFDPVGLFPDAMLMKVDPRVNKYYHQNHSYLLKLLYESKIPVEYNNYKLQEKDPRITTCGRHAIMRVACKDIGLEDYVRCMRKLERIVMPFRKRGYIDNIIYYLTKDFV